jgi:hypothetical protein
MAMGTRTSEQSPLWIAASELPKSPGHPFYVRLSAVLDAHDFDRFVEELCSGSYAPVINSERGWVMLAPPRLAATVIVFRLPGLIWLDRKLIQGIAIPWIHDQNSLLRSPGNFSETPRVRGLFQVISVQNHLRSVKIPCICHDDQGM